jgi:hypothetical protein
VGYVSKTESNNKCKRGWRALQLGLAADGTRARHGGPHWHRRAARAVPAGRPAIGQGEVEVALSRDEELVTLIGGRPPPCCADEHRHSTASQAQHAAGTPCCRRDT